MSSEQRLKFQSSDDGRRRLGIWDDPPEAKPFVNHATNDNYLSVRPFFRNEAFPAGAVPAPAAAVLTVHPSVMLIVLILW